ncbi:MAG: kelch repeat-containing protein [Henriciella sp.]|uniref:Kelch repeat-containing protein n=1 Tax=Henriciella sp. TaxID=1968823 RepID=UPI003C768A14
MSQAFSRRQSLQLLGAGLVGAASVPLRAAAKDRAAKGWRGGVSLPSPVQEIYPCLHDGRIHLAGGFVARDGKITGPTAEHHAFNASTGYWEREAALPVPRHHPQLVSYKGSLFCIGGFESRENGVWQMQGDMWRYDEAEEDWAWAPDLPAPTGESVAAVADGLLFVIGGRLPKAGRNLDWDDHTDIATNWVFDGEQWTDAAPMPTARNSAAGGVIDGYIHIVGGRTVGGGNTAEHEVYDPASDRWERLAPLPKAQGGLAAATVGNRLFAFGGEYFGNGGGVYPDTWEYDAYSDTWRSVADMPQPRHGLGAVALDGDIYVIGGARKAGGTETSAAVEIYRPGRAS